jgi:hypothetical protein
MNLENGVLLKNEQTPVGQAQILLSRLGVMLAR